jgi:DNA-binding beta-propeller fold protein YncE
MRVALCGPPGKSSVLRQQQQPDPPDFTRRDHSHHRRYRSRWIRGRRRTALSAQLWQPHGLAIDASGTPYIADLFNNRVRKIDPTGKMNTVVGDGTIG